MKLKIFMASIMAAVAIFVLFSAFSEVVSTVSGKDSPGKKTSVGPRTVVTITRPAITATKTSTFEFGYPPPVGTPIFGYPPPVGTPIFGYPPPVGTPVPYPYP